MKNKIRTELNRELQTVSISRELKGRILMAAAEERFPEQNKRIRIAPLAAAAAVILICGLTLGVISLRTEKIDRRSTALSSSSGDWVWISDADNLYHSQSPCGETAGMVRAALEQAKAQGRSACQECMTGVQLVTGAESEVMLVWANAGGRYYHSDNTVPA